MSGLSKLEIPDGVIESKQFFSGLIERRKLNHKFEYYKFDVVCTENFLINFQDTTDAAFYLCVNLSENNALELNFSKGSDESIVIPSYTSFLMPFESEGCLIFSDAANKDYNFVLLKIFKKFLAKEELCVLEAIYTEKMSKDISELGSHLIPNLSLCKIARKLNNLTKDSCENKFIAAGYCNIIIGLKLVELNETSKVHKLGFLQSREINELELLTDKIKRNPEVQYSIDSICRETGISVSKLQAGFKEMHNCTVAIFIRNVRLEKALELFNSTDLNVYQIVYSVGFNSRSYFSRIFKERFKCSPKLYQKKLKNVLLNDS